MHLDSGAPGPQAELIIKDYNFARRLLVSGEIGFGEAYLQGEWESPRLETLIELMSVNRKVIDEVMPGRFLQRMLQLLAMRSIAIRVPARDRISSAHYDLGNAFYESWLDQTMTYSSAVFAPGDNDLAAAQARKYRLLAERAGVRPGENVLEIGCGWGGFAEFAARELGCKVTGLTISKEQFDFATERMRKAGLADRVTIALRDYRDERGVFDRIVSIEMFEAVGEGFWPSFFRQMRERLRPGGTAGLQVITIAEWLWPSYRREVDFIRRYIFPGGMLPTATHHARPRREIRLADAERMGLPPGLCGNARPMARTFSRRLAEAQAARLRRALPPHVGILPLLLRRRLPRRLDRCAPDGVHAPRVGVVANAAASAERDRPRIAPTPSCLPRPDSLRAIAAHGPREQRKIKRIRQDPGEFGYPDEPPRKGDLEPSLAMPSAMRRAASSTAHEERHRKILLLGQRRLDETRVDELQGSRPSGRNRTSGSRKGGWRRLSRRHRPAPWAAPDSRRARP